MDDVHIYEINNQAVDKCLLPFVSALFFEQPDKFLALIKKDIDAPLSEQSPEWLP
ncbi:hypothetical protein J27TS8_12500 [Robertmurraya siralis]|uniref:Uncharacterized protein n=1 Tax=Robertmurraya siralis TaxID=77777 RepID=A0A919WGC8_9BACI|nr:hypothetical protein J27TS8_12500 [Robertmurraya siralis]